jgi:Sap, sulfolipid-1-addressing protein
VLAQAAGLGLLAAVSPTALLVTAIFLASDNPRVAAFWYAAGALIMTLSMALAVLFILRAVHLNETSHRGARYELRFALGVIALLFCAVLVVRRRRATVLPGEVMPGDLAVPDNTVAENEDEGKKPGLITRMTANPRPLTAFIVGLVLFAPGATFIAAVQVVATSNASNPVIAVGLLIVVALTALTVWLPLLAYLAAPEATTRSLRHANGWIKANGRAVAEAALAVAGIALVINGALGAWG